MEVYPNAYMWKNVALFSFFWIMIVLYLIYGAHSNKKRAYLEFLKVKLIEKEQ